MGRFPYRKNGIAPTVPFGDINLVVLTDVHSWVAGHFDNEGKDNLDVSYGDVVSFFERLKGYCAADSVDNGDVGNSNQTDDDCADLWLVQNGDWIDGTGLATDGDPSSLIPILEKIPFDVLNTGNHELYKDSVISDMRKPGGFLQWWGPRHLASNVYMNVDGDGSVNGRMEPMSNRFHVLHGRRSTVLVFGFLYNMPNPSDLVVVQTVEEAIEEDWFLDALTTVDYNAILVMLHAGHDDPSVEIIRHAIRRVTAEKGIDPDGNLPIQFIAGHTHYRRYAVADAQSTVVEAGRYMDTVGWVSFPNAETIQTAKEQRRELRFTTESEVNFTDSNSHMTSPGGSNEEASASAVTDLFHHVFLDANKKTLREALGLPPAPDGDDFHTPLGKEVSAFIDETRDSMGLSRKIGCAPNDYPLNRSMAHEDSLWRLYRDEVGPHAMATARLLVDGDATKTTSTTMASKPDHRRLFMSQDSWRYGLYGGKHLTYDDIVVVSPFNEPIYRVSVLPCSSIGELEQSMNANTTDVFYSPLPAWIVSAAITADGQDSGSGNDTCELYVNHFGLSRVYNGLQSMSNPAEIENTTAWDPIETNLTTTSIWFSFVEDQWPCEVPSIVSGPNESNPPGDTTYPSKFGNGSILIVIGVFSLVLCLRIALNPCKLRKKGTANGGESYDGILKDDDEGFSSNEESAEEEESSVRIV